MIKASYLFANQALPVGTQGATDVLVCFHPTVEVQNRRRLNLSLVIDRSGSMAGMSLKYALDAATAVIDKLSEEDRVSVVVFDDEISTIIPPQHPTDKAALKETIRQVRAGGITNLSGGWLEGCKHVKAHFDPKAVNRVLLLTDGQANDGITDKRILTQTAAQKAEEGIVTTTLGFGSWFEEDLLISMARAAGGNFYFIQSKDEATDVFSIELDTLKSVVAQNLTLTLTPESPVSISDYLTLAKVESTASGVQINLGDVLSSEDKLLGLTLDLPALQQVGYHKALSLQFSVDVVENGQIQTLQQALNIDVPISVIDDIACATSTGARMKMARLKIAHTKEKALKLSDEGHYAQAEQLLKQLIATLQAQGLHEKFEIAEEIEQLDYFATRFAGNNVSNDTRKELRDQSFQGLSRSRADLSARGTEVSHEVGQLTVVKEVANGIELVCVREGGKLRIKINHPDYDNTANVQFPRAMRAEGAKYVVEGLDASADGSFYRVRGSIQRLVREGEADLFSAPRRSSIVRTGKASKAPATAADLEVVNSVGDSVLVQCVKDGSKLRARVVSDGFESTWNMRFPRSIREEGMLYAVDEVVTAPDGKSYIACGKIKRFEQA